MSVFPTATTHNLYDDVPPEICIGLTSGTAESEGTEGLVIPTSFPPPVPGEAAAGEETDDLVKRIDRSCERLLIVKTK